MSRSRIKNTARNATFGMINQIITLLFNFIGRTIFINVLGAEYLGISGLFSDILKMLSMADLGFGTAMVYSFYKPLADGNKIKISALITFYKKVYNIIAISVAVIGVILVPFLKYIIKLDTFIPSISIYYLLFLFDTVISYLFVYKTSIIYADQKNYIISKYSIIINCVRIVFQSVLLITTKSYFIYLIIQVLSTLIINLITSKKANELYPYINDTHYLLSNIERKSILENMKSIFVSRLSGVLLNGTDNALISAFVGTIWVGFYSNYNLIISSIGNFVIVIFSSATASIGSVIASENNKKRFEVFLTLETISLMLSTFLTVCVYTLINDFIYIWIGPKYILNEYIVIAISLNFYLGIVIHPILSYREATGIYMKTKYVMLLCALENLVLSIIMGKLIGVAGILFATAISKISTYYWYEPKLLFQEYFNEPVKKYYIKFVKNLFFTIMIIYIFKIMTKGFIINSWVEFFIKSVIIIAISFIVVIGAHFKTDGFNILLNKIKGLFSYST